MRYSAGTSGCVVVGAAALLAFVGIVGPDASVQRATVMAAVLLVGRFGGRTEAALPALGLAVLVLLALDGGDPWRGALLAIAYCIGLGIPFLLVALGLGWVTGSVAWLKRHIRVINIIGGSLLIAIGLLMVSGLWRVFISNLGSVINGYVPAL